MNLVLVIPAYKPTEALIGVVRALCDSSFLGIVVVDDGCGPEYKHIFDAVLALPKTQVARHAVNLGKGTALRTGLNFAAATFPKADGFVTADADGQHLPEDILKVAATLQKRSDALVLGARTFSRDIPLRSWFGNQLTRKTLRLIAGWGLRDTQTGLRGIPRSLALNLLRVPARGYEFELEMLTLARQLGYAAKEVNIQTVYLDEDNTSSHFNPVKDSYKIYRSMFRFFYHYVMAVGIEILVFGLCMHLLFPIWLGQLIARILGPLGHYNSVRESVFHSIHPNPNMLLRFLAVTLAGALVSYGLIVTLSPALQMPVMTAKILAETLLFTPQFVLHREWVFKRGKKFPRL